MYFFKVILIVLVYFGVVIFCLTPQNQLIFRRLSLPIWLLVMASISCWWTSISVPLFLILSLLLLGGLWTEAIDLTNKQG